MFQLRTCIQDRTISSIYNISILYCSCSVLTLYHPFPITKMEILTDWNLSNVLGNDGLANSNKHLNLRPDMSSSTGRANTIGSGTVLRHSDSGNSWLLRALRILRTGITDMSTVDDDTILLPWNMGWAQSSLSVLLSTPESLDVITPADYPVRANGPGIYTTTSRGHRSLKTTRARLTQRLMVDEDNWPALIDENDKFGGVSRRISNFNDKTP